MGYLVPERDVPRLLPDGESRNAAAVSRYLEIQIGSLAVELYLEFVLKKMSHGKRS